HGAGGCCVARSIRSGRESSDGPFAVAESSPPGTKELRVANVATAGRSSGSRIVLLATPSPSRAERFLARPDRIASRGVRPRLQRRVRGGLAPPSLRLASRRAGPVVTPHCQRTKSKPGRLGQYPILARAFCSNAVTFRQTAAAPSSRHDVELHAADELAHVV